MNIDNLISDYYTCIEYKDYETARVILEHINKLKIRYMEYLE